MPGTSPHHDTYGLNGGVRFVGEGWGLSKAMFCTLVKKDDNCGRPLTINPPILIDVVSLLCSAV